MFFGSGLASPVPTSDLRSQRMNVKLLFTQRTLHDLEVNHRLNNGGSYKQRGL